MQPPPMRKDNAAAPQPSLIREPHLFIPDVTLGRSVRSGPGERTTRDYAGDRRRRRGRRVKFTLAGGGLLLVLLVAGAVVFVGGTRQLGDSSPTSSTTGLHGGLASPPAYDTQDESTAWWRSTDTPDPAAPGGHVEGDFDAAGSKQYNPLTGLASVDTGRLPEPTASDAAINTGRSSPLPGGGNVASTSTVPPAPITPETDSRAGPSSATDFRKEPYVSLPAPAVKDEPQSQPAAPRAKAGPQSQPAAAPQAKAEPQSQPAAAPQAKAEPQPQPAAAPQAKAEPQPKPAAKPAGPQAKPSTAQAKASPARSREIEALLAEGDAWLAEGDMAAARSAYEQAYDKGSRAAALRMAQTFDPRSMPGARKTASPAEAILWYQDAARKGDRTAKEELDNLAGWLENDAASGNQEARRVLELWRQPAEPEPEPDAY
jgi:hypothetical protein